MSDLEDLAFVPERFSGKARLFPLPNLVMFPHVMQPLHIFEPRYRALLADSLADDSLIAMALLGPGWERDYEGRPPLLSIACLARVATYQKQPDDRFNVLLMGLRRVRVIHELDTKQPFRVAEVEVIDDEYPVAGTAARPALQVKLVKAFQGVLPNLDLSDQLDELLSNNLPLGALTDIVAYSIDLECPAKADLLAEPNVDRRASLLLDHLSRLEGLPVSGGSIGFPPQFSVN